MKSLMWSLWRLRIRVSMALNGSLGNILMEPLLRELQREPEPDPQKKSPWEMNNFISLRGITSIREQDPFFVQDGWKEIDHSVIVAMKNRISDVENADEWELRKKITNPYEVIFSGEDSFPSLVRLHPLSRSYFKMIEMLNHINFWESVCIQTPLPFSSAHICEGPGGFIQCVTETLAKLRTPTKAIHAMTLRPTKSHIPGWRRSTNFLKKNPHIQLHYGEDDTGNILNPANQLDFSKKAKGSKLFTADGGFDFSVNYTNQERMAFPLLMASFTMGLLTLDQGGTMIIKLFDIYGKATQDLFLGASLLFEQFTIYKPATSRPCNSERYFIGVGYIGAEDDQSKEFVAHLQAAQLKHQQSPLTQLFRNAWPSSVTDAVNEQIQWQENLQLSTINDTLTLDKESIFERMYKSIRMSKKWCDTFGVRYD